MPNEKIVANIVNIYRYRFCILLSKFRQADRRLDKNLLSIIKLDFGEIEILLSNLQQKIIREKPALKKYLEVSCLIILLEMTLIAAAIISRTSYTKSRKCCQTFVIWYC
jgi:hypothetical protein